MVVEERIKESLSPPSFVRGMAVCAVRGREEKRGGPRIESNK